MNNTATKFTRATAGQPFVVAPELWNKLVAEVERLARLACAPPLYVDDNGNGRVLKIVLPPGSAVFRMKVTDPAPSGASTGVVLAKKWDGTTATGDDTAVLGGQGHSLNDDFLATLPVGGVAGSPTDGSSAPVLWVEYLVLPVSTSRRQVVQVIDTAGKLGIDSARFE